MCWDTAHGNQRIHEEPREPYRKGDRSATVGHTHLQGRTRRERKLEPSTRQNRTSGIRTSRVPGGHPRHDNRKATLPRRGKITVQRKTGLDRRENEGRAIQRQ